MPREPPTTRPGISGTAAGFLVAAFGAVGMIGYVANHAAPLPYLRALHREQVLDQLLATPPAARPALREALGDSADAVLGSTDNLPARVAAERVAMRARFAVDAADTTGRFDLLIGAVTLMAALFGVMMLGVRPRG